MDARGIGATAALLAGVVWTLGALLGWGEGLPDWALLPGLGLALVALTVLGYRLVATGPLWLRGLISVGTPVLGYVVWAAVLAAVPEDALAGLLVGAGFVVAGLVAAGRVRAAGAPRPAHARPRGRRAAR